MPFLCFQDQQAIAHVGVLRLPLWLARQAVTAGSIHGVCTYPQFRRQGYFRRCMSMALDYCASRYGLLLLTTSQPELYTPFEFRVISEQAFIVHGFSNRCDNTFRLLNLQTEADRQILRRLLSKRQPVSNVLGVVNEKAVFCFNEGQNPLYYADDLDLIVVMEITETRLSLFDVVWQQPCQLTEILDRLAQPIDQVVFYFSPDCFDVAAQPFPHILGGNSLLIAWGEWNSDRQPLMLPRSARC